MSKHIDIEEFAKNILEQEGLSDWSVGYFKGGVGHCDKEGKRILLGDNATFGVVLHEIAHALDKNPPTKDGHWGHHADLMHQLFDKVISTHFIDNRLLAEELEKMKRIPENKNYYHPKDIKKKGYNAAITAIKNKFLTSE